MKVSESWLREWVNPSLTGAQLAAQLTMAGLEVDGLYPVAGAFDHVVVAKVLDTKPHPHADKLTLCDVDAGAGRHVKVVCGAANVRKDLLVALALPGAHLPGDIIIKESNLRGELSQGMLCSVAELGLDETSEGIMELPKDAPVGLDLREYLSLNDQVLDIDLTPNRADCFSILGVAREVAALNGMPLNAPPVIDVAPTMNATLEIQLKAPEACPQYCGRILKGIRADATTPFDIKERLRRSGIRSIHPVVDVTNYVMLELGQPMHAFDLQHIDGQINVRYGSANETLLLLDGQELTLDEKVLVIADAHQPLAIAGVMGGQASSVQPNTTDIFLESAFFNPLVISGVARRYGLSSDSSQRFERGVDPTLQIQAIERATELLQSIVGGEAGPVMVVNQKNHLPAIKTIVFLPTKVKQLTGLVLPENDMLSILKRLGMDVHVQKDHWDIRVPSHRFDLTLDVDLVEEIARLYGYDNIKAEPLIASIQAGKTNESEALLARISTFLSSKGYHEAINYSFVDPALQEELYPEAEVMQLLNPISSELSVMRVGLWPGLLAAMIYNSHRQQEEIKLFEVGVVFDVQGETTKERACVAGLLTGEQGGLNWCETIQPFDFYDVKGDLQSLFAFLNIPQIQFAPDTHPALHPGKTARIMRGEKDVGWLGVLHPRLADALEMKGEVLLFELSLPSLIDSKPVNYQLISKYPQIRRDLSLLVNDEISSFQIEQAVRAVVPTAWLKSFDVFDVYTGENIPMGKKSLAIALTLQDDHRTLVDAEINEIIDAILKKLDKDYSIILREVTR